MTGSGVIRLFIVNERRVKLAPSLSATADESRIRPTGYGLDEAIAPS
jgi:hypothetical protein